MPLSDYQTGFMNHLFSVSSDIESEIDPAYLHRLGIYRNNVRVGLKSYLADVYPAIKALVGDDFFNAFCQNHIETTPPTSGNLHDYGDALASALARHSALANLPYLADVAHLEWAYHRAYYAPSGLPLAMPEDPNLLLGAQSGLAPSVSLLESPYPIDELWRQSLPDFQGPFSVQLEDGPSSLLVLRARSGVKVQRLDAAAMQFLRAIESGRTFGSAIESAMSREGAERLTGFLSHCFHLRLFCRPE